MSKVKELAEQIFPEPQMENYDDILEYRNDRDWTFIARGAVVKGYEQAKQDLWHNVKDETPMDGERLLLINRNGEYGTTMLMMPILYKEFRKWEKWAYIKDLIPSE